MSASITSAGQPPSAAPPPSPTSLDAGCALADATPSSSSLEARTTTSTAAAASASPSMREIDAEAPAPPSTSTPSRLVAALPPSTTSVTFSPRQLLIDHQFFGGALSGNCASMSGAIADEGAGGGSASPGCRQSDAYLQSALLQRQTQVQLVKRLAQIQSMANHKEQASPLSLYNAATFGTQASERHDADMTKKSSLNTAQQPTFNDMLFNASPSAPSLSLLPPLTVGTTGEIIIDEGIASKDLPSFLASSTTNADMPLPGLLNSGMALDMQGFPSLLSGFNSNGNDSSTNNSLLTSSLLDAEEAVATGHRSANVIAEPASDMSTPGFSAYSVTSASEQNEPFALSPPHSSRSFDDESGSSTSAGVGHQMMVQQQALAANLNGNVNATAGTNSSDSNAWTAAGSSFLTNASQTPTLATAPQLQQNQQQQQQLLLLLQKQQQQQQQQQQMNLQHMQVAAHMQMQAAIAAAAAAMAQAAQNEGGNGNGNAVGCGAQQMALPMIPWPLPLSIPLPTASTPISFSSTATGASGNSCVTPQQILQFSQFGGFAPSAFIHPTTQVNTLMQMQDALSAAGAASLQQVSKGAAPAPSIGGRGKKRPNPDSSAARSRASRSSSAGGDPEAKDKDGSKPAFSSPVTLSSGKQCSSSADGGGASAVEEEDANGGPTKKIKSETSLAHKLSLHAKSLAAEPLRAEDKWGILDKNAFSDLDAILAQLYVRQQERDVLQAANSSSVDDMQGDGSSNDADANSKGGKGSRKKGSRKKSKAGAEDSDEADGGKASRKVPHNAIERRYRNNINDRIAALRNAVPALRDLRPKSNGGSTQVLKKPNWGKGQQGDLVDGVSAATKLNKATILGKATEYIQYLKRREVALVSENEGLKELVRSLRGGEDVLAVWLSEMEQTKKERDAEKARLKALQPADAKDELVGSDDEEMRDISFDVDADMDADEDEEDSLLAASPTSSTSGQGASRASASNYMMAAFLGFTFFGGGTELTASHHVVNNAASSPPSVVDSAHAAARQAGATLIGASHQLLKRANVVPPAEHHLDHVPSHLLLFEILRFASFFACMLFAILPFVRYIRRQGNRRTFPAIPTPEQQRNAAQRLADVTERKKAMLSTLGADRISARAVDKVLRAFVGAPTTDAAAAIGIIREVTVAAIPSPIIAIFRKQGAAQPDREEARVWLRLLEVETAWGPFAEPSLLKKTHTILKVRNIQLLASDQACNPARVHATMALALGRLGATDNAIGRMMRASAIARWRLAHQAQLVGLEEEHILAARNGVGFNESDSIHPWLSHTLQVTLEEALALCPSESAASTAALTADANTRTFLATPLLLVSNVLQMQQIRALWCQLFPSLVMCAGPETLASKDDDAGGISVKAFISEFNARRTAGLQLIVTEDENSRMQITDKVSQINRTAARGTPAHVLASITLAAWSFLLGDAHIAHHVAMGLKLELSRPKSMLGASTTCATLVRLVLGDQAIFPSSDFAADRIALPEDDATFALVSASLMWLKFLRLFAASSHSNHLAAVLEEAFSLRRALARAILPECRSSLALLAMDSRPGTPLLGQKSTSPSINGDASSDSAATQEAKEALIDILSSLCHHLGQRAAHGKRTIGTIWEDCSTSDSGLDFV
ncbi:hypothetical protein K437DRAFT_258363 [Tilletiaria anomala UBC 951]|uniref:BHLH domain-containing protein n=1 Tax=Tilletiaria anomala (strain ATCC 24038 / CBS 436.72 / UBC 951) TaxID=1037660 RepID=A0A066VRN9_TILAU|nr:uncharacterized protein K437DRAFT_258363 [Tilletiaria anomala UBC 951]KDN41250.1 hypothetical protein K437DRAFT_258363 [Tilletiaria anomala UBC 951]